MRPTQPIEIISKPFIVKTDGRAWSTVDTLEAARGVWFDGSVSRQELPARVLAWVGDVVGLARWHLSDVEVRYSVWFARHFREQKSQPDHRGKAPSDRNVELMIRTSDEYLEHQRRIGDAQRALEAAIGVRDAVRFITRTAQEA